MDNGFTILDILFCSSSFQKIFFSFNCYTGYREKKGYKLWNDKIDDCGFYANFYTYIYFTHVKGIKIDIWYVSFSMNLKKFNLFDTFEYLNCLKYLNNLFQKVQINNSYYYYYIWKSIFNFWFLK